MASLTMCDRCSDVKENYDNQAGWVRVSADDMGPKVEFFDLCLTCWREVKAEILGLDKKGIKSE